MNAGTTEIETVNPAIIRPICIWKIVMSNNLRGRGTSFDPSKLSLNAARCLNCDGYAVDCRSYSSDIELETNPTF